MSGLNITIRTHTPGKTNITITNNSNGEKEIIECLSHTFTSKWGTNPYAYILYPPYVIIDAEDRSLVKEITEELLLYANGKIGTVYDFSDDSDKLNVFVSPLVKPRYTGTYSWDMSTHTLTFEFNNIVEKYRVDLLPIIENSSAPPFVVYLSQDFTEKYALKHTEMGIKEVTLVRPLFSYGIHWWNDKGNNDVEYDEDEIIL